MTVRNSFHPRHVGVISALVFVFISACGDDGNGNGGGSTGEFCDNDIDDDGDGDADCADSDCDAFAACLAVCGDGVVEGAEACDEGDENSNTAPNGCREDCTAAGCGDGVVDDQEACDDGAENSDDTPNACREDCSEPTCGDEVVDDDVVEACDDGDQNSDDTPNACREDCSEPTCGDEIVDDDFDEDCDDGEENADGSPNACREDCSFPACGDGTVDNLFDEDCDDGNTTPGDGCTSVCTVCDDDDQEDQGDSPDSAAAIDWPGASLEDRVAQPGDADWYVVTPPCSDASVVMSATFLPVGGEVRLRAFSEADVTELIGESEEAVGLAELTITSSDAFFLAVESDSLGVCSTYDLDVAIDCTFECDDDSFEENDTAATAEDVSFVAGIFFVLEDLWALDFDYFAGTLPALCDLELNFLAFEPEKLELTLEVGGAETIEAGEGFAASYYIATNASDSDADWWLLVEPVDFAAAGACVGYAITGFLECGCENLLFNDSFDGPALLPSTGGTLPQQRTNNLGDGVFYQLDLCDDGTINVAGSPTAGGDGLVIKILGGDEAVLVEGTNDAAVSFTNETGGPLPVWVQVSTDDECTYFALEVTTGGCVCIDDELEPDDDDENKTALEESDSRFATAVFADGADGGDPDYYGVPLCGRGVLDVEFYWIRDLGDLSFSGSVDSGEELITESSISGSTGLSYSNPSIEEMNAVFVVEPLTEGTCTPYEILVDNECPELDCDNNTDDDGDSDEDCDDDDCMVDPSCMELDCDDGLDNDDDGATNCDDPDCAITTACGGVCPQTDLGSATGVEVARAPFDDDAANLSRGSCGGEDGPDASFTWSAPDAGQYRIDTIGSELDTVLYVRDSCQGREIACNDDLPWRAMSSESSVTVSLEEDDVVLIFVDSYGAEPAGDYVLNIAKILP